MDIQELIPKVVEEMKNGTADGKPEGYHISMLSGMLKPEDVGELFRDETCVLEAVVVVRPSFRML